MSKFSEESLEDAIVEIFNNLGWKSQNCYEEKFGENGTLGRETQMEVVLVRHLREALLKLNPNKPQVAIDRAVEEITKNRSMLSMYAANQEIHKMLKDGVKVEYNDNDGIRKYETIRIIDWRNIQNNDFFLAKQFWVTGKMYTRRADLVGFINGIPLVFIELKSSHNKIKEAYSNNLTDYKNTIPQVFWYNSMIILSNGSDAKVGSITSSWEFFNDWKKINNENEKGIIDIDTMIKGVCDPQRLLDIIENFIIFTQIGGKSVKIFPKNHQYLGVNNVFDKFSDMEELNGKLGVFWHTQGSGKTVSMMALGQKVLRIKPGNWTFLIVTDRVDLDDQVYKNFVDAGIVSEPVHRVRAQSGEDLKRKLSTEDHRFLFTTIHKFSTNTGEKYPELSQRSDIIVITDEAHRTEYGTYAVNMRHALPNASFIGFTGTPLIGKADEKTKEVFGDYVSIYNFNQSIEDKATVPLYYENRLKKLQFKDKEIFEKELFELIEKADLDSDQEDKLEREFAQEKQLIIREDRLEAVAEDIVNHFMGRGFQGKAMVVSIDKATALKMYEKVRKYWNLYIDKLRNKVISIPQNEQEELRKTISYMEKVDMAVVVSPSQNEISQMQELGLDIIPHRERMNREDLASKFKDAKDPLQIVFLCAMWFTGFDVPHCSTLYLDKPMKNHTLMQTIARVNRVYPGKDTGFIVDYISIFKNLKKALAIYATGIGGTEIPILEKGELVEKLRDSVRTNEEFLRERGLDLDIMKNADTLMRVKLLDDVVDSILSAEELKSEFAENFNIFSGLYKAIMPDPAAYEYSDIAGILRAISQKIKSLAPEVNIDEVRGDIEKLLDRSILPESYSLNDSEQNFKPIDISSIDFEKLREDYERGRKNIEIEKLKNSIREKMEDMILKNKTRIKWRDKFEKLLDEYNSGIMNMDSFFDQLLGFGIEMNEEDDRKTELGLEEEELAIYDLLMKPEILLSKEEKEQVKNAAKKVIERLKEKELIPEWRLKEQNRASVKVAIMDELYSGLPEHKFPGYVLKDASEEVYSHVYEAYWGGDKSVYVYM